MLSGLFFTTQCSAQTGWRWGYGSVSNALVEAGFIAPDHFGNVYGTGYLAAGDSIHFGTYTLYNPSHYWLTFITKANASGYVWVKGITNGNAQPSGITTDNDGNIYVLGTYYTTATLDAVTINNPATGMTADYVFKISPAGTVLWGKSIPFATNYGQGICVSNSGNIYVSGNTDLSTFTVDTVSVSLVGTHPNLCIVELTPSGTAIRANSFGPYGYVTALRASERNNIYVTGFSSSITFGTTTLSSGTPGDINFIAKLDSSLHPLWAKGFSKNVFINDIATGKDESVYFTGKTDTAAVLIDTATVPYIGIANIIVGRYDSAGVFSWIRWLYGSGGTGRCIATDICGKIWIGASVPVASVIYYNDTTVTYSVTGFDPYLVTGFNTAGHYTGSNAIASGGDDQSTIAVDNGGNFYVCGDYINSALSFGSSMLPYATIESYFFAKYTYDTVGCSGDISLETAEINAPVSMNIFPVPATSECTVNSNRPFENGAKANLYDLAGKLIGTWPLSGERTTLQLDDIASGMYMCRINSGFNVFIKIIVVRRF